MSTDVVPIGTYETGLDDLTSADLTVPRLRIAHKDGVFKDSATNEELPELICVILGLVRQRVLFHHNVEDGDKPMCKSPDFKAGYPTMEPTSKEKAFPWERAGFDPNDFPPVGDRIVLPCESCKLREWDSHPVTGKKPYCAEQFTLPIFYAPNLDELKEGRYASALITFQKTGVPPTKKYLSPFVARKLGAYTVFTRIGLTQMSRGQTDYCVPNFQKLGDTNEEDWPEYSENYGAIRKFLQDNVPGGVEDMTDDAANIINSTAEVIIESPVATVQQPTATTLARPPMAQATAAPVQSVAAPAEDDDSLPF